MVVVLVVFARAPPSAAGAMALFKVNGWALNMEKIVTALPEGWLTGGRVR